MIRNGEISMSEVKRILKRYWWILPLTIFSGGALALGLTFFLPKRFTSQSRVQIHEQDVSTDLVKPIITEATNQRLNSMVEEILSRTRLQGVVEKLGLYPSDRGKAHMEDMVAKLRASIEVTPPEAPLGGQSNRQLPGFYINVTFDDPEAARRVCSEITTMFLERNATILNQRSTQTTEFFAQQADDAKSRLDEQDGKLAEFKKKYMGSLPDQEQANLSLLATLNSQLEANTQNISRTQQDKALNESLLASQLANWKAVKTGETTPETLDQQLTALQEQLAVLQSRYTPEHPDVIKTTSQIEQLKKRMEEGPKTNSNQPNSQLAEIEPPAIQQLRVRIKQDEMSIADFSKRQDQIQGQIGVIQSRIQLSPAVEQQFKEVTRSYQSAMDNYNELMKKHNQAAIATDLTRKQEGEQFSLEDAPSLPMTPSFPKKSIFAGVGLGGGLVLGLGILYLLAALDSSLHTERDVEVCLKLPVLALVPAMETDRSSGTGNSKSKRLEFATPQR